MELRDIIVSIAAILSALGLGGWITWRFKPKVERDIDELTREKLIEEAVDRSVGRAREEFKVTIDTLVLTLQTVRREHGLIQQRYNVLLAQNTDQQRQLDALKLQLVETEKRMKAKIAEVRSVFMKHISSWKASVMHADVSVEIQQQIISRVEPLPDGYDREEGE